MELIFLELKIKWKDHKLIILGLNRKILIIIIKWKFLLENGYFNGKNLTKWLLFIRKLKKWFIKIK